MEISLPCHSAERSLTTSKCIPIREKSLVHASKLPVSAAPEDIDFNTPSYTHRLLLHLQQQYMDMTRIRFTSRQHAVHSPLFVHNAVCAVLLQSIVREHGRGKPDSLLELPVNKSEMR